METSALTARFPNAKYYPEWRLLTWHPVGILDTTMANAGVDFLEHIEPEFGTFNRFVDLSHLTEIRLPFDHIFGVAKRRIDFYTGEEIQTVILAPTPVAWAVARMYAELMKESPIHIHVVSLFTSAMQILGVPPEPLIFKK